MMRSEDTARFAAAARSPYGARYFRAACWLGLLLGCYAGIQPPTLNPKTLGPLLLRRGMRPTS